MVPSVGLLNLGEAEHIEEKIVAEVVIDQDPADFVEEELFRHRIDLAGYIAVADDDLDGILVAVVAYVLFDIILIRVKSPGVIIRPLFSI